MDSALFRDRHDAGRRLAERLEPLRHRDVVVVGLPRGGVPVAFEVARALDAALDVIVVRKLGVPYQPELAMGAIGEGGVRVFNDDVVASSGVIPADLEAVEAKETAELARRARRFRQGHERIPLAGRVVVIVDDGIATGATARAACQVARAAGAKEVILAVPVAPIDWTTRLAGVADSLICLDTPYPFHGVGRFYQDFQQTADEEVVSLLRRSRALEGEAPARDEEVVLTLGPVQVGGHLVVPEGAFGLVVFAHGSGSSRHSPRNRAVAAVLNRAGLATLLFDLLTEAEETKRGNVFDIPLLGQRLIDVATAVGDAPALAPLPMGFFGASTGAGAALWAAAALGDRIAAVVSRGGRPDLAGTRLADVRSPTLLIVGAEDRVVLDLNRTAQGQLRCPTHLEVVPHATHLFEEPGTLRAAAEAARDWFVTHLR